MIYKKELIVSGIMILTSCMSVDPLTRAQRELKEKSHQRVFIAPYEQVWKAIQLSISYPLVMSDMDEGILETDWIQLDDGFISWPQKTVSRPIEYKIKVFAVKGTINKQPSVRVTIDKTMRIKKNFFNETRALETDKIEEMMLFYRISRELSLAEAIRLEAQRDQAE